VKAGKKRRRRKEHQHQECLSGSWKYLLQDRKGQLAKGHFLPNIERMDGRGLGEQSAE
jgi:hypothetical protein